MARRFINIVSVKLDTKTVNELDRQIEGTSYDRSKYIRQAIKDRLRRDSDV